MKYFRNTKKHFLLLFFILILAVIYLGQLSREKNRDILYQVSTIGALMAGGYDAAADIKTIKNHGDFGIGTFEGLDGEMIMVTGNVYQIKSDGSVHLALNSAQTPFALVTFFDADKTAVLNEPLDFEKMKKYTDNLFASKNIPYALKIQGKFDSVKVRSVPRQQIPYPGLAEAVKEQSIFEVANIEGIVVGFKVPEYMQGLNTVGYHLHFLSADRKFGGHLLDCKIARGIISVDDAYQYNIVLPKNNQFSRLDLSVSDTALAEK